MERKIGTRQILYILTLFLIAQFAGLLLTVLSASPAYASYVVSSSPQNSNPVTFIFWLAVNIVVAVLIIMLILRYYKGDLFFKLLEAYIIIFGSFFLFFILIYDIVPAANAILLSAIALILAISLFIYKAKTNKMRNLITMITAIGAGLFLGISIGGSFGFLILYLLIGIFAIYDYLAVFVLKFMIPFAKEASNRNLAFMIGSSDLELLPNQKNAKQQIKKTDMSKINNAEVRSLIKEGNVPVVSSIMLGNGDIILPLTLVVGSYILFGDIFLSSMIIVGAGVGLIATVLLLRKYKVGLPAIPPLFTFMSIALAIVFVLGKPANDFLSLVFIVASILSFAAMILTLWKMNKKK